MKSKQIITAILLIFVVASLGYMVVREMNENPQTSADNPSAQVQNLPDVESDHLVVYYFRGDVRCPTCEKLESYAEETLKTAFQQELADQKIIWQVINTDQPGNAHFVTDYNLVTKSIILSAVSGGKQTAWKNLDQIWKKVGEKQDYQQYIRDEIRQFLEDNNE